MAAWIKDVGEELPVREDIDLRLGEFFNDHDDRRISYFCNLREKYRGVPVFGLMTGDYDCALDGHDVHPSVKDRGADKWANRGDCAILDYLPSRLIPSPSVVPLWQPALNSRRAYLAAASLQPDKVDLATFARGNPRKASVSRDYGLLPARPTPL
jgi:hypothetical protein